MNPTVHAYVEGHTRTGPASIFERIVVGVDSAESSLDACRLIAHLALRDSAIEIASVVHLGPAVAAAYDTSGTADRLEAEADEALMRAGEILGGRAGKRWLNGFVTQALLDEMRDFDATLLAIGKPGHSRATEVLLGGPGGELLHRSPCSVLVARNPDPERFPKSVVVGHDGSHEADAALSAARQIAERLNSTLAVVAAERHPVDALCNASRDVDLLVVGSRGLRGPRALGSVAERVAHRASCSVLVVRGRDRERPC